ncbi:MAG: DUF1853 family protein, partial [Sinobacterium sp.]|nr:DUF1853 family protein [Sinobacterium sp.]
MQQIIDIQADLQKICTLAELHLDENDSVFSFNQHFESEQIACLCAVSSSQLAEIQQLNTYRLGIYYERLWRILIDNSDNFHCVLQNQQLIENKQTLGEFDFIIEDTQSHQFSHLEIAIKFYLNISHLLTHSTDVFCKLSAQENTWRGPNSSDSLATKYTHLINKQLKLSSLPAAQKLLATHKVQTPTPCFSLKGYLFNHWQHQGVKPAYYSGEVIEHHWLYADELDDYLS